MKNTPAPKEADYLSDSNLIETDRIDRRSSMPLYHQLFLSLRDRLFKGEWNTGDLFLRDSDIETAYQLSRITVRKAMDALVDEGLVVRFRGKGTFVAARPIPKITGVSTTRPSEFSTFEGAYRQKVIEISKVLVSKQTADRMHVPDNHMASMLKLLHCDGDIPICLEVIFIDDFKWPNVFERESATRDSLETIYARNAMHITRVTQSVTAISSTLKTAKSLDLSPGQPLLFINRIGYATDGVPIDFRLIHCRSDRFTLTQNIDQR